MQTREIQLKFAHIGDFLSVLDSLRDILVSRGHFFMVFKINKVAGHLHTFGISNHGVGANTQQNVMGNRVILEEVMGIVGSHQGDARFIVNSDQLAVNPLGFRHRVALDFQVKIAEGLFIPGGQFPGILQAGTAEQSYYTNSSQLPAGFTDDPFEALERQEELQRKYTGGTVLHLYLGERVSSADACKKLVRRSLENYRLPYITITPTFSVCPTHGYLAGEHQFCPKCDEELFAKKQREAACC